MIGAYLDFPRNGGHPDKPVKSGLDVQDVQGKKKLHE